MVGSTLDDGRLDPVRKSLRESNTSTDGFEGHHPLDDVSRVEVPGSPSATPVVVSQASQDSGFLSTPSCDASNHRSCFFDPSRKTTVSSFESVTSDTWRYSVDDSAVQQDAISTTQQSPLLAATMNRVSEGIDSKHTVGLCSTHDATEHKANTIVLPDASACHIETDSAVLHCLAEDTARGGKCSTYLPVGNEPPYVRTFANTIAAEILKDALVHSVSMTWSIRCSGQCSELSCQEDRRKRNETSRLNPTAARGDADTGFSCATRVACSANLCWTPELPYGPGGRSRRPPRLSSASCSHDSLVAVSQLRDDSRFIKEAVSHEVLSASSSVQRRRSRMFEPEIYSCPVDTLLRPAHQRKIFQPKAIVVQQQPRTAYPFCRPVPTGSSNGCCEGCTSAATKANKATGRKCRADNASICASCHCSGESKRNKSANGRNTAADQFALWKTKPFFGLNAPRWRLDKAEKRRTRRSLSANIRHAILSLFTFRRTPKQLGGCVSAQNDFIDGSHITADSPGGGIKWGKICPLPSAPPLRRCNKYSAFSDPSAASEQCSGQVAVSLDDRECRRKQSSSLLFCLGHPRTNSFVDERSGGRSHRRKSGRSAAKQSASKRALPPLPPPQDVCGKVARDKKSKRDDEGCDFASIIDKVKDYGWYWGPISGESAEKVLSNEPDGSFIVRDSSDYHYIFSLTFRLNGVTRHVRIEHDQGNFSFGGFTRFKSQTIVDFIEKAVEHSRSGRYLFFLHRRPVLGPMRVQLMHPVSRFKHVQSLQHLCRFAIVNNVRRDLINSLPLPQRLKEYLSSPHYYSELVERCMSNDADDHARSPACCRRERAANRDCERGGDVMIEAAAIVPPPQQQFGCRFVHAGHSRRSTGAVVVRDNIPEEEPVDRAADSVQSSPSSECDEPCRDDVQSCSSLRRTRSLCRVVRRSRTTSVCASSDLLSALALERTVGPDGPTGKLIVGLKEYGK